MGGSLSRACPLARRHKVVTGMRTGPVLRSQGGHWEGSTMAHIEGPRPKSWRDRLWLLMTAAGVLLLVCATLAV